MSLPENAAARHLTDRIGVTSPWWGAWLFSVFGARGVQPGASCLEN